MNPAGREIMRRPYLIANRPNVAKRQNAGERNPLWPSACILCLRSNNLPKAKEFGSRHRDLKKVPRKQGGSS
jgi:hypothetical protein